MTSHKDYLPMTPHSIRINYVLANDQDHYNALKETGFWGKQGAGCIVYARDANMFLLAKRSRMVQEPGFWGIWGGAIDPNEDPKKAVLRELEEETEYKGPARLKPLLVFTKGSFRYHNFVAIVPHAFKPELNWESSNYMWCKHGEWPEPLHFGLVALFNDKASIKILKELSDAGNDSK